MLSPIQQKKVQASVVKDIEPDAFVRAFHTMASAESRKCKVVSRFDTERVLGKASFSQNTLTSATDSVDSPSVPNSDTENSHKHEPQVVRDVLRHVQQFNVMDKNGDGVVDREEFKEYFQEVHETQRLNIHEHREVTDVTDVDMAQIRVPGRTADLNWRAALASWRGTLEQIKDPLKKSGSTAGDS